MTGDFIDAEEMVTSTKKDDLSFRFVVISHLRKICTLASVEFRGGYWQSRTKVGHGGLAITEKFYVPDTREEYSNSIAVLHDLILPYFKKLRKQSIDYEAELEVIEKALEELRDKFLEKVTNKEEVLSEEHYKENEKMSLSEYKFAKLRIHRKLLQLLSRFLADKHYFEAEGLEE